jgi:Zn-finger nucleic acid-binding protein
MKCPQDGTPLAMSERLGVEIDYCPSCRGVWLDRGELDKIIERSLWEGDPGPTSRGRREHDARPRQRKRKSWLSEIFEFGD